MAWLLAWLTITAVQPQPASAQSTWTNANGKWEEDGNWSPNGAPTNTSVLFITNGLNTVTVDNATADTNLNSMTVSRLTVGMGATLLVSFTNSARTLWASNMTLGGPNTGSAGAGALVLSNGSVYVATVSNGIANTVGNSVTVTGGSFASSSNVIAFGTGTAASMVLHGGTSTVGKALLVGRSGGSTSGKVVVDGGLLVVSNIFWLGAQNTTTGGAGELAVSNNGVVESVASSPGIVLGVPGGSGGKLGKMTIAGGSVTAPAVALGSGSTSTGLVTMTGGTLTIGTGGLLVGNNGAAGIGAVSISGGTNVLNGRLSVGALNGATGSVLVSGAGFLEFGSSGAITNGSTSGYGTISNRNGGTIQFDVNPTIVLNNGSFVVTNATISFKGLANADVLGSATNITVQAGSTLRLDSSTNAPGGDSFSVEDAPGHYSRLALAGANTLWQGGALTIGKGGTLLVSNATATVASLLTISGTVRAVNSTVTYQSNVVIRGDYFSDPSTNIFAAGVTLDNSGSFKGSNGDVFVFSQDFVNQSTNRSTFNMASAAVVFTNGSGSTNHVLNLTGSGAVDMGSNWLNVAQLATNFSIGTLRLAAGNSLTLSGTAGDNALYVGWLDLGGTNNLAAKLSLGVNLYYERFNPGNEYLDGLVYSGLGAGLLIPIPEPSSLVLLLLGVAWVARRRQLPARPHRG